MSFMVTKTIPNGSNMLILKTKIPIERVWKFVFKDDLNGFKIFHVPITQKDVF